MTRKKIYFAAVILTASFLTIESACRLYWTSQKIPFLFPGKIIWHFYPSLKATWQYDTVPSDEFSVLLLSGSVLNPGFGNVETSLKKALETRLQKKVAITNLATPAHTSRDSFFKYKYAGNKTFDLVLVYDSINDLRANNCPTEIFKPDYSHFHWYRILNNWDYHPEKNFIAAPFTINFLWFGLARRMGWTVYLPEHTPRMKNWKEFGFEIKSAASLANNFEKIIELSKKRKERIVLLTFAYHVPQNYSLAAFRSRKLNYGKHSSPIEVWGSPSAIQEGLRKHNEVIYSLGAREPLVTVLDLDAALPKNGAIFDDICHLTETGGRLFAKFVASRI